MKSKFSTHLSYFWWLYALIAVVFALFWVFIMDAALQPKATEQLKIYVLGNNIDEDKLKADLTDTLPNITSQNIKEVKMGSILDEMYNTTSLNSLLFARAQECDFMIVEDELIPDKNFAPAYFNTCNQVQVTEILENVNFYVAEYNGASYTYGIQISGDGMKNNFTNYYGKEDKCWLMFCFKTVNMGELIGNSQNEAALKTIQWLLAEVE